MSGYLIIEGNERFLKTWEGGSYKYEPDENSLLFSLNSTIEIRKNTTTIEQFFNHFINDPLSEVLSGVFYKEAGHRDEIFQKIAQLFQHPDAEEDLDGIDYFEIYHPSLEMKHDRDLEEFPNHWEFHGWGDWDDGSKGGLSVSHLPLCNIKDGYLNINNSAVLMDCRSDDPDEIKFDMEYEFKTAKPTLMDAMSAIIYDMTFYGFIEPGDKTPVHYAAELASSVKLDDLKADEKNE